MKNTAIFIIIFLITIFTTHSQIVNIPDANFKKALIEQGIDKNNDGVIQLSEAEVVDSLNVSNKKIENLTGIEAFTALKFLNCNFNSVPFLDFSKNIALTTLFCVCNNLTSLNITENKVLETLYCYDNQLSNLDVINNTALRFLLCQKNQLKSIDVGNTDIRVFSCEHNQITAIDVSQNRELVDLNCSANQITSLDLRNNKELHFLHCGENPKLKKICITKAQLKLTIIDDIENYWWTKNKSASWVTDCE